MSRPLGLFEGFGLELEYMIVDRASLAVQPLSDRVLHAMAGAYESEVAAGELAWSNELVLHVIELKTNGPAPQLAGLSDAFHRGVRETIRLLEPYGAGLMPTAMHPWMDPAAETHLWPHEYNRVYEAFNRIFDCRGHGWANLQSAHLNLPFSGDDEFGRLHAAVRLVLPILPALAASSPVCDRRMTGLMDNRLDFYRRNCLRVPSVTGRVIPEPVFSREEYVRRLLDPLYGDIAPYDPDGVLQHEWLNARGAIARFDRSAIEIRLLDIQECPRADLAIAAAAVAVIRDLVEERFLPYARQKQWDEARLEALLLATIRQGDRALISDPDYLRDMGCGSGEPVTAGDLWRRLVGAAASSFDAETGAPLEWILDRGCLARRILDELGGEPRDRDLERVYRALCECLEHNRMFRSDV